MRMLYYDSNREKREEKEYQLVFENLYQMPEYNSVWVILSKPLNLNKNEYQQTEYNRLTDVVASPSCSKGMGVVAT